MHPFLFTVCGVLLGACIHMQLLHALTTLLCLAKAFESQIEVSGDMMWMNNTVPSVGGAVHLTSHAQLRLHPSANLTFVTNSGR